MSEGYVYILTNDRMNVLYTGCTNSLKKRVHHHRQRLVSGFTRKYNVHRLVYYERCPGMDEARLRERQIKGLSRAKRVALINSANRLWDDLYSRLGDGSG